MNQPLSILCLLLLLPLLILLLQRGRIDHGCRINTAYITVATDTNTPVQHPPITLNSSNNNNNTKKFPSMEEVIEMATLSSLIYAFHTEDYGNDDINNTVCDRINHMNHSSSNGDGGGGGSIQNRTVPSNIHCEWYHHDWIDGTQVMIVSTKQYDPNPFITIIFAGTDDITTSLTDVDVLLSPFGYPKDTTNINTTIYPLYNVTLSDPNLRVHTGFDTTLFNTRNLFGEIVTRVEQIRTRMIHSKTTYQDCSTKKEKKKNYNHSNTASVSPRIYTTGHSLGGGYSILMAIGLTQYYDNQRHANHTHTPNNNPKRRRKDPIPLPPEEMTVINFGCPQIGNIAFRDYIHSTNSVVFPYQRLHIYRYVLGWDIVPRLPTLLQHVGHTIQLSTTTTTDNNNNNANQKNITTAAYYHHLGNVTLQYASVPFGWSATPFIWIPGAVTAHYITAYIQCLNDLQQQQQRGTNDTNAEVWITDFERSVPISNQTIYDDDYYIEPPNDDGDVLTSTITAATTTQ